MGLAIAIDGARPNARRSASASVAVVDRAGRLKVFLQADGATRTISSWRGARPIRRGRSRTVGRLGEADRTELPSWPPADARPMSFALGGGVPIMVGDETIGGVGLSGAARTAEEECAMAGSPRSRTN